MKILTNTVELGEFDQNLWRDLTTVLDFYL